MRAEQRDIAASDLTELDTVLGLPTAGKDTAARAAAVRLALESSTEPWLLVFDDVEDQQAIEGAVPAAATARPAASSRPSPFLAPEDLPAGLAEAIRAVRHLASEYQTPQPAGPCGVRPSPSR